MMEFFQQLPHLEPYGNPQYFVYVIAATLPIFIGLFFKKRFAWYEVLVSLFFIVTMFGRWEDQSVGCLGYLPLLGKYCSCFSTSIIEKARMASGSSTQLAFYPSFRLSLSRCSQLSMERSLCLDFGNFLPDLSFGWDYHRAERWSD